MDTLLSIVETINAYLSDYILIILLVGAGLYFTIRTRFVQIRCFGEGMRAVFGKFSLKGGKQKHGSAPSRRWQLPSPHRWVPVTSSVPAVRSSSAAPVPSSGCG